VATDFRLYVRDTIDETDAALAAFQHALVSRALEHAATVMPGFTHLQTAQPVTFGHPSAGLCRDGRARPRPLCRCAQAAERIAARRGSAGGNLVSDRSARPTAKALGFDRPMANSLDAVSDRDFVLETLSAASIAAVHMSALRRGNRDLDLAAGRPGAALRQVHHRLLDHAAEAQSGCLPNWCAPRPAG
jgi:argininosuccinate lyase